MIIALFGYFIIYKLSSIALQISMNVRTITEVVATYVPIWTADLLVHANLDINCKVTEKHAQVKVLIANITCNSES